MEVQIEVRIHHPARPRSARSAPPPSAAAATPVARRFRIGSEAIPVRRAVQQFQRHDPRTSPRICLAPMHQIVDRPKLVGQPGDSPDSAMATTPRGLGNSTHKLCHRRSDLLLQTRHRHAPQCQHNASRDDAVVKADAGHDPPAAPMPRPRPTKPRVGQPSWNGQAQLAGGDDSASEPLRAPIRRP